MKEMIRILIAAVVAGTLYISCTPGEVAKEQFDDPAPDMRECVVNFNAEGWQETFGVWIVGQDGALVSSTSAEVEPITEGYFRWVADLPCDVVPAMVYAVSPYQGNVAAVGGKPVVRIPSSSVEGKAMPQIHVASAALTGDGTQWSGDLEFIPVSATSSIDVTGLDVTDRIHHMIVRISKKLGGLALISDDGAGVSVSASSEASDVIGLSFPEGSDARTASLAGMETEYEVQSYAIITSDSYIEGNSVNGKIDVTSAAEIKDAMTFDFIGKDGRILPEMGTGGFTIASSSDGGSYRFACENGSFKQGQGLVLSGDMLTSGTLEFPTPEGRQITRIIVCLDQTTSAGMQSVWLECYDGENWDKIEGTQMRADADVVAKNGYVLDFVFPKSMVSAAGVYRLFNMGTGQTLCIRSVTILHEEETCSHHPMSLIEDGFSKWRRCGTNISAENNFYPDELVVLDKNVSHVDDGSGSLKFIAPTCSNGYKPWIGWRYPTMTVEAGATYRIYFCIKTENVPDNASIFLSIGFKNAANQWLTGWVPGYPDKNGLDVRTSMWVDTVRGTHDWMKLSAEITVPEDAVKLDYFQFMLQNVINAPDAYIWFDDINMIRVN